MLPFWRPNARHHPPAGPAEIDDRRRVAGRVQAVVGCGLDYLFTAPTCCSSTSQDFMSESLRACAKASAAFCSLVGSAYLSKVLAIFHIDDSTSFASTSDNSAQYNCENRFSASFSSCGV